MSVCLGNLTVNQIEERIGVAFPDEIRSYLNENHQDSCSNIKEGKWHCFDIPFAITFGDVESATKFYNAMKDYGGKMKQQLGISIQGGVE